MSREPRRAACVPPQSPAHGAGLAPDAVAARLSELRALYVPESDTDARARLARERPVVERPFASLVDERLRELRALCELARYLHTANPRLR